MTIATLTDVLGPAMRDGYAVAGLVCQGWEDIRAFAAAAEAEGRPVILQAGPGCRAHTPLPILAKMMRHVAEGASVPVVIHLDHAYTADECRHAIGEGFTSVMFDGSRKPVDQNINETAEIARLAHDQGVSCEGEIGFVGYAGAERSDGTKPDEAERFAAETGVDALAVSVGNVHLQKDKKSPLDEDRIAAIEAVTTVPLVIHGGSGVPPEQRRSLAHTSRVKKFNIGTELRMAFGDALRASVGKDGARFDRIEILSETEPALVAAARTAIRSLA
ncbi:MAG: class II fructose-bisphosphate aldolase [Pseudomonadota bacterium]